jgi:hypothetical protein
MTLLRRTTSPLLLIPAFTFFASVAFAQAEGPECASDSDCAAGSACVKDQWSSGCAATPDGSTTDCDAEVHEAEFGICVTPPQACQSDADCGEYLGCVEENVGTCSQDPSGEITCEEVESESYCGTKVQSCETDSDCPREFECMEAEMACLTIECPEDKPDCGGCSGQTLSECRPKAISCDTDDECPSDWSCMGTMVYECSGGGGDSAGGGSAGGATSTDPAEPTPDPADNGGDVAEPFPEEPIGMGGVGEPEVKAPEETCVEVPAVGSCYPNVWGGDGAGAASSGDTGAADGEEPAEAAPPKSSGNADSDEASSGEASTTEGGCSVSPVKPVSSGWLLSLFFVLPALRRRFAQSSLKL